MAALGIGQVLGGLHHRASDLHRALWPHPPLPASASRALGGPLPPPDGPPRFGTHRQRRHLFCRRRDGRTLSVCQQNPGSEPEPTKGNGVPNALYRCSVPFDPLYPCGKQRLVLPSEGVSLLRSRPDRSSPTGGDDTRRGSTRTFGSAPRRTVPSISGWGPKGSARGGAVLFPGECRPVPATLPHRHHPGRAGVRLLPLRRESRGTVLALAYHSSPWDDTGYRIYLKGTRSTWPTSERAS